jgi:hypothetical protein
MLPCPAVPLTRSLSQRMPFSAVSTRCDALEQLRPVLHQPLRAEQAAGLLVGEEREHEVARRHDPFALEVPRQGQRHADHVLHVDRAASPHVPVLHGTGERVHGPLGGVGGHDVEVTVDEQRAPAGIRAGQPGDHVASPLRA